MGGGRLSAPRRDETAVARPDVAPKSIAAELLAFSMCRFPYDALLADGLDGDDGDSLIMLRRFAGGSAVGGAGESQKNDPSPGEPENDAAPENTGDAARDGFCEVGRGESTSISVSAMLDVGDSRSGSV